MAISLTYGDYNFSPRPLLKVNKTFIKTIAESGLGTLYNIDFDGYLIQTGLEFGIVDIFDKIYELRDALDADGKRLLLTCDGQKLIDCRPRIIGLRIDDAYNSNYTKACSYNITFQVETLTGLGESINNINPPPFVNSFSESWNIAFDQDISYNNGNSDRLPLIVNISHNMSAAGVGVYTAATNETGILRQDPWKEARDFLISKTGFDRNILAMTGLLNFEEESFVVLNNGRSIDVNESDGSVSLAETFVAIETGSDIHGLAREIYDINIVKSINEPQTKVTINGTIEGFSNYSYGTTSGTFNNLSNKFNNASGYWTNVKPKLYYRVNNVYQNIGNNGHFGFTLNSEPLSNSIGVNQARGVITYNYEYDDRPTNCISGAIFESIIINDTLPGDLIAQLTILGRTTGPLLQSIGTKTPALQRNLTIEAIVPPGTGCTAAGLLSARPTGSVNAIIQSIEDDLESSYSQVFRTADANSWNVKQGRYSQNVTWTYSDC